MVQSPPSTARPRRAPAFGLQVLAGMAAGVALGLAARALPNGEGGWLAQALHLVGQSFVQLLKALVPPLVFTAIVGSLAALREVEQAARLVAQTLLWFALTALLAVLIGIALAVAIEPGRQAGVTPAAAALPGTTGGWLDFLHGLVPGNFLGLAATTTGGGASARPSTSLWFNVLQLIVIAAAVGAAAVRAGVAAEPFLRFNAAALAILRQLLRWVIALTPMGTAGLLGDAAVRYGWAALGSLGAFAAAVYLGLALVLLAVYPLLLVAHGLSPRRFLAGAWPAIQLGFVSRSSVGALPLTEAVAEALGVPPAFAAFAVPLAATTKMDGCAAVYPAVSAIFVAQFYGVPLHALDYLLIVLVAVLGSAATADLTGATVMLTLTLSTLGLPLDGVGLLLAVDPILDMGRTAVNVAGQALVPVLVARRAGLLDLARWHPGAAVAGPLALEAA